MSDLRDNDTDARRSDPTDEELVELPASVRAAFGGWAETFAVADAALVDRVMAEVVAMDRAEAWSEAFSPELPEDFAQAVLDASLADEASRDASVRAVMRSWAEEKVPELPEDFAQAVTDAAFAARDSVEPAAQRPSGVVEKVVPRSNRRRWVAPAAVSSLLAAAAVAVLSLSGIGRTRTVTPPPRIPQTQPVVANPTVATQTPNNNAGSASNGNGNGAADRALSDDTVGSEVERVEVEGDLASFSAFSLVGEDDHSSVAVVWIDDGVKQSPESR
jgi:hypothetical protein